MNIPGNARSAASKAAIRNVMLDLLGEKDLEKITVQDIVKRAGINRSTFYAHYMDISDLMAKTEAEMVAPLSAKMYSQGASADTIFSAKALMELIAYFRKNRTFYRIFFANYSKSKIIREAAAHVKQRFIVPYLERTKQFTQEEYAFQFEFCMAGFLGVISKWLDGDCAEADAVVAGALEKLIWKCLA